jgi:hypothetical protein
MSSFPVGAWISRHRLRRWPTPSSGSVVSWPGFRLEPSAELGEVWVGNSGVSIGWICRLLLVFGILWVFFRGHRDGRGVATVVAHAGEGSLSDRGEEIFLLAVFTIPIFGFVDFPDLDARLVAHAQRRCHVGEVARVAVAGDLDAAGVLVGKPTDVVFSDLLHLHAQAVDLFGDAVGITGALALDLGLIAPLRFRRLQPSSSVQRWIRAAPDPLGS